VPYRFHTCNFCFHSIDCRRPQQSGPFFPQSTRFLSRPSPGWREDGEGDGRLTAGEKATPRCPAPHAGSSTVDLTPLQFLTSHGSCRSHLGLGQYRIPPLLRQASGFGFFVDGTVPRPHLLSRRQRRVPPSTADFRGADLSARIFATFERTAPHRLARSKR